MEYLLNTSFINSVLPKTDPARTITVGTILYLGWTHALYPMLKWTYQTIRAKIRERNHNKFRAQQKKDVVYLYMFPKKTNEPKPVKPPKKSSKKNKSKKEEETNESSNNAAIPDDDQQEQQQDEEQDTEQATPVTSTTPVPVQEQSPATTTTSTSKKELNADPKIINKMSKMFSLSCPCMSVELFLRINKIPFEEVVVMDAAEVSPTGRLPMIELNGETYTDSWYILDFLEKKYNTVAVNAANSSSTTKKNENDDNEANQTETETTTTTTQTETPEEALKKRRKANFAVVEESKTVVSVQRIVESLRLCYGRAVLVDNVEAMIRVVSSEFQYPKAIVNWIFKSHRAETITMLNAQGLGDLTDEQFQRTFLDDVKTLTAYISAHPSKTQEHPNDVVKSSFILGGKFPTKIDFLVAPYFNVLRFYESEKKIAENCPAIVFVMENPVITDYLKRFDKALNAAL
jgi:hypothetical protein